MKESDNLDRMADEVARILDNEKVVYFLRSGEYLKVGTSDGGIIRRIADLQVGNPIQLKLEWFILGSNETERKVHKILEKFWVRGEWHRIEKKELLAVIKQINGN